MSTTLPDETGGGLLERGAREIALRLTRAGFRALWAGGCVRDRLMGRPAKDYDIATNATPDEVLALFPRSTAVGKAFGVVCVPWRGASYEIATFRRDRGYADGRRPDAVEFTDEREDAMRRDFTVNGLFYDPERDEVLDYINGLRDLQQRVIRAIGDPFARFGEDRLRLLRAVRFASTLEFGLDPETECAIRKMADSVRSVSAERIQMELTRLLVESPRAGQGIRLLERTGLLRAVLPEVAAMAGQEQPPEFHPEGDVLTHTVIMLDAMQERDADLAWTVLLHDVGKPATAAIGRWPDGRPRIRFDRHADVGAEMARGILTRLRMPRQRIETVVFAIANHMRFKDVQRMRRATLRRLIGAPTFPLELELHRLDCVSSHGVLDNHAFLEQAREQWREEKPLPPPLVSGHDLLAMGIPEGPELGRRLRAAYEAQLEHPDWNRAQLLELARQGEAPGKGRPRRGFRTGRGEGCGNPGSSGGSSGPRRDQ